MEIIYRKTFIVERNIDAESMKLRKLVNDVVQYI